MLILVLLGFVISAQIKSVAMEQKKTESAKQEQIAQYEALIEQTEQELSETQRKSLSWKPSSPKIKRSTPFYRTSTTPK